MITAEIVLAALSLSLSHTTTLVIFFLGFCVALASLFLVRAASQLDAIVRDEQSEAEKNGMLPQAEDTK